MRNGGRNLEARRREWRHKAAGILVLLLIIDPITVGLEIGEDQLGVKGMDKRQVVVNQNSPLSTC